MTHASLSLDHAIGSGTCVPPTNGHAATICLRGGWVDSHLAYHPCAPRSLTGLAARQPSRLDASPVILACLPAATRRHGMANPPFPPPFRVLNTHYSPAKKCSSSPVFPCNCFPLVFITYPFSSWTHTHVSDADHYQSSVPNLVFFFFVFFGFPIY